MGRSLWVNVVFMLGIIVANVSEGLLPTFTLALSMASLRMARKHVFVKSLDAMEALGAVHVICTDKTGTLTRNELALSAMLDPLHGESISESQIMAAFLKTAIVASEGGPPILTHRRVTLRVLPSRIPRDGSATPWMGPSSNVTRNFVAIRQRSSRARGVIFHSTCRNAAKQGCLPAVTKCCSRSRVLGNPCDPLSSMSRCRDVIVTPLPVKRCWTSVIKS